MSGEGESVGEDCELEERVGEYEWGDRDREGSVS